MRVARERQVISYLAQIDDASPINLKHVLELIAQDEILFARAINYQGNVEYYMAQRRNIPNVKYSHSLSGDVVPYATLCLALCNKILGMYSE